MGNGEDEVTVDIPVNDYSSIEVTIDGDDFVLEVARRKPRPLVEVGLAHVGGAFQGVLSHPVDVGVAYWYGLAFTGALDFIWPRASANAKYIARIILDNFIAAQNPRDRRAALKMLMLYYETDVRGMVYTKTLSRLAGGAFITGRVFKFMGRAPGVRNVPGAPTLTVLTHNTVMSSVGALVGAGIEIAKSSNPNDMTGHIVGPHMLFNAVITGDTNVINLPQIFGTEQYFALQRYLRENPDAIQLDQWELRAIDTFYELVTRNFFQDPVEALNEVEARGGIPI